MSSGPSHYTLTTAFLSRFKETVLGLRRGKGLLLPYQLLLLEEAFSYYITLEYTVSLRSGLCCGRLVTSPTSPLPPPSPSP